MQLRLLTARINPSRIHYAKFILEGYDNIALLSTIDSEKGVIVIRYPEAARQDILDILKSIDAQIGSRNV